MSSIISDGTDSQFDSLPFIIGTHFRDRDIELMLHFIHHAPDNFPLSLQGTVIMQMEDYFQCPDYHTLKLCRDLFHHINFKDVTRFDILKIF